jgi:hypothetical protein
VADALLRDLQIDLGVVIEEHSAPARVIDLERYRNDPVAFAIEVLRVDLLWEAQRQHLRAVAEHPRVAAYGANGCGKTFDDAIIALWWVYCRNGLVVATSAREGQLKEQFMRDVKILFHRAVNLAGELYGLAVRRPENPLSGILCVAAGETSRIRGQHAPNVMVQLQESQGLEEWVFQAAEMMAVGGDSDRMTVTGNCDLGPVGPFYKACRSSHWRAIRFNAEEHPNVVEGRAVIPGGPTRASLAQRAGDYGVDSGFYISSVKGEFPTDALEGLIKVEWLDDAFANFERGGFITGMQRGRLVLGIDVARSGGDRTVVCTMRGPVITEFQSWRGADLEITSGRVVQIARELGIRKTMRSEPMVETTLLQSDIGRVLLEAQPGCPDESIPHARRAVIRFDTIGLGSGPYDRLTHERWPTESFNAAAKPVGSDEDVGRFANRRAQAYWTLRQLLEERCIALPPAFRDDLVRELTVISWAPTGTGKILIESKADIRARLRGDSPDFADALAIAVAPDGFLDFSFPSEPVSF